MKIGKLFKTAIKLAPIIYPIVKKALSKKKSATYAQPTKRR